MQNPQKNPQKNPQQHSQQHSQQQNPQKNPQKNPQQNPQNPLPKLNQLLDNLPGRYFNILYFALILVSLLPYLLFRYAPSLDGPQHLHNAYVIKDLVLGRGIIPDYLAINPRPVGYWTTQLLLAAFTVPLPPWLGEKLLLICYVILFAVTFRYFTGAAGPAGNRYALFLVFPFVFSYYILTGNHAFGYGIALFFMLFGFWDRISTRVAVRGFREYRPVLLFSLLLLLLYFTHSLIYSFFLFAFFLYLLTGSLVDLHPAAASRLKLRQVGLRVGIVILAIVPSLIPWLMVTFETASLQMGLPGNPESSRVLIENLYRMRPLIGFHHGIESVGNIPLFLVLMLVLLGVLGGWFYDLDRRRMRPSGILLNKANLYLFLAMVFLVIYLVNPDRFTAGDLTGRAGLFFFLLLIMWVTRLRLPGWTNLLVVGVVLFAVIYKQAVLPRFYAPQNEIIAELQELDPYLEEGSTVWPLTESDNWLHRNYHLYIGLEKHTVNLQNPQTYGPFPIIWNRDNLPVMFAGDLQLKYYGTERRDPAGLERRQVETITVFYYDRVMNHPDYQPWRKVLSEDYELVAVTSRGSAAIYRAR